MKHVFVDTHVHLHSVFRTETFFDAALAHMTRHAGGIPSDDCLFALCLTDGQGIRSDERLLDASSAGAWRFSKSDTGGVCAEHHDSGDRIHVLPGRQIVSREALELLALDTEWQVEDGRHGLAELAKSARDAGAVSVAPWGFGKWTGSRGEVVEILLETDPKVWPADNGNRLRGTPEPGILQRFRAEGRAPLAGSDPLPFRSQETRAGSYVTHWETTAAGTASEIFRKCLTETSSFRTEGSLAGPASFLRDQLAMQIRKRLRRNA